MEIILIGCGVTIVLLFGAISMMRQSEEKAMAQHTLAKAELEKAKQERESNSTALTLAASHERALILEHARQEASARILAADLHSKNELKLKIEGDGAFAVEFTDGSNEDDQGVPRISWRWTPFDNAVIKIYRNSGSILEDIATVMSKAELIHVEPYLPSGSYHDKEAKATKGARTYNYYAFIETRRTGVRPKAVTRDLPEEVSAGAVIDEHGNEILSFETFEPETYEEPFYSGFRYRRVVVEPYLDQRALKRQAIRDRREDLEIAEEEQELERLEREIGLRSGVLDTAQLEAMIEEAKRISDKDAAIRQAEDMLAGRDDIDERQREIILAYIRKAAYR